MKISTKGRYALRVMIDLGLNNSQQYIPLRDIAEREGISKKYLENIMTILSKAGYVDAMHGKGGGFRLNRSPQEYSVGSILKLTEGTLAPVACLDCTPNACERAEQCKTLPMWKELDQMIDGFLENKTLKDLMD